MIRCHGCGRRLADSDPRCPTHGSALARPPSDEPPPPPMAAPEIPGYALGRLLGQGGFGAVFKAERLSDHQAVALKIARPDNASAGESLLREVAALSALGPPAVPEVFEQSALADETRWVAMELIDAPTLAERMTAVEPLSGADFQKLALQILDADRSRASARSGALRSQAREHLRVRRRPARACSTSGWSAWPANRTRRPRRRKRRRARPSTCRRSSARDAPTSTRAATSMRQARSSMSCCRARRRSGAIPPTSSKATAAGARRRSRGARTCPRRSRKRSCAASPRIQSGASRTRPSWRRR